MASSVYLIFVIIFTVFTIQILKPLAPRFGLLDFQDHRKHHVGEIPLVGGIAMYLGVILGAVLLLPSTPVFLTWLLTSAGIVLLGVWDDAKDIPVRLRLITQALLTLILSIGTGFYLESLGNIFSFGSVHLGYFGYVFTVFAVLGAINAFNMMDGIDGLAGVMALVSYTALGILFYINGNAYGLIVSLLLIAVTLPYLANNLLLPPFKHKIFMGDAGAMFIGFSIVWLLIYGSQFSVRDISFRPVTALWLIAIPLMDMASIILRRLANGQSPFKPGRDHLHHIILGAGFSSGTTLLIITVASFLLAMIGVAGEIWKVPESIMLASFLFLFFGYSYVVVRISKSSKLKE